MSTANPPATAAKALMTADEFWDFCQRPENQDRMFELIRGEVVEVPRPTRMHGVVQVNVAFVLKLYARSGAGGYVATESGVVLDEVGDVPDSVVGPDVAYYTGVDSFAELPPKWGDDVPVLAVEVLSPNDKISRVNARIEDFLRNGVKLVWLVDYEDRTVTVYRPDRSHELRRRADELTGDGDLPGFTCRVADFFQLEGDAKPAPPVPPAPTGG